MLSEAVAGISPRDLCRRYQISLVIYYKLKNKFSGMMVSDLNLNFLKIVSQQC